MVATRGTHVYSSPQTTPIVFQCSMATLATIPGVEGYIRHSIEIRYLTHEQLSRELSARYPTVRGLSAASVKRYCLQNDIHRTARIDQQSLDRLVYLNVMRVNYVLVHNHSPCTHIIMVIAGWTPVWAKDHGRPVKCSRISFCTKPCRGRFAKG